MRLIINILKYLVDLRLFFLSRPPALTQYPSTQKSFPLYHFIHPEYSLKISFTKVAHSPLRSSVIPGTQNSVSVDSTQQTWSSWTGISGISKLFQPDSCCNIPSTTLGKRFSLQN